MLDEKVRIPRLSWCYVRHQMKRQPRFSRQSAGGKLAACATLIPGATSLYYWEGKLEQEYEVQMILKTTVSHQQALLECLKSHHPYQTPELLVLPVTHGDTDYLSWLNASLR